MRQIQISNSASYQGKSEKKIPTEFVLLKKNLILVSKAVVGKVTVTPLLINIYK